jgi:hypothetical protein
MVAQMRGMGADMGCSASAMAAEMNRHQAVACASTTDMTPNKAEAQQHVSAMTQWAGHAMGRSHDLASMAGMGMGNMGNGSTTGRRIHNADGSYAFQPWRHPSRLTDSRRANGERPSSPSPAAATPPAPASAAWD